MRRSVVPAAVLTATLLVVGCSRNDDGSTAVGTTTATVVGTQASDSVPPATGSATTPDETSGTGGIDPMPTADTSTKSAGFTGDPTVTIPLLRAVRVARQEGFDRIVFEFEGTRVPGYEVGYTQPPILEDASGETVPVAGSAFLRITMQPSSTVDLGSSELRQTYDGPTRWSPGTPVVRELVRTGDFEAVLTWVAGLSEQVGFRVSTLASPPRLVIDVRNH